MKKFQSLIVAVVVLAFGIAAFGAEPKSEPATIGTAEMKADGTIVLRLLTTAGGRRYREVRAICARRRYLFLFSWLSRGTCDL